MKPHRDARGNAAKRKSVVSRVDRARTVPGEVLQMPQGMPIAMEDVRERFTLSHLSLPGQGRCWLGRTTVLWVLAVALSYERPWCTKGFARVWAMGDRSPRCCLGAALGLVREVESGASLLVSGSRGAARLWVIVSRVAWLL